MRKTYFLIMNQIFNSNDPSFIPYGKGKRNIDPRWSQCHIGQSFFVERTEQEVKNNKRRPTIPAAYKGRFKTKGGQLKGHWGYKQDCIA